MIRIYNEQQYKPNGKHLLLPCVRDKKTMVFSANCTNKCKYYLKTMYDTNVHCMVEEEGYLIIDLFYLLARVVILDAL